MLTFSSFVLKGGVCCNRSGSLDAEVDKTDGLLDILLYCYSSELSSSI